MRDGVWIQTTNHQPSNAPVALAARVRASTTPQIPPCTPSHMVTLFWSTTCTRSSTWMFRTECYNQIPETMDVSYKFAFGTHCFLQGNFLHCLSPSTLHSSSPA